MDEQTKQQIRDAVREAFSADVDRGRYVDMSRIPLICASIVQISKDISAINETMKTNVVTQDAFWPVKTITYGIVGLILAGVVGALLTLVIK